MLKTIIAICFLATTAKAGEIEFMNPLAYSRAASDARYVLSPTETRAQAFTNASFSVGTSTLVVKNGFVGIGNTNPDTKLHISSGAIKVDGSGTNKLDIYRNDAVGLMATFSNTYQSLGTVGAPNGRLAFSSRYTGGSDFAGATIDWGYLSSYQTGGAFFNFQLMNTAGSNASVLTLKGSGNIGIGVTNPDTKLHISSGTITVDGTGSPSAGYALCLTATKQMGRCSNTPDANGACTCAVN
jgi:hypothetical protein